MPCSPEFTGCGFGRFFAFFGIFSYGLGLALGTGELSPPNVILSSAGSLRTAKKQVVGRLSGIT
jgi:hypothetical protein